MCRAVFLRGWKGEGGTRKEEEERHKRKGEKERRGGERNRSVREGGTR